MACGSSDGSTSEFQCGTPDQIPFIDELSLPSDLTSLKLSEPTAAPDGPGRPIKLGKITGRASEITEPIHQSVEITGPVDQVTRYTVVFVKNERHYGVVARVSGNTIITWDDVNAVALSIAEN